MSAIFRHILRRSFSAPELPLVGPVAGPVAVEREIGRRCDPGPAVPAVCPAHRALPFDTGAVFPALTDLGLSDAVVRRPPCSPAGTPQTCSLAGIATWRWRVGLSRASTRVPARSQATGRLSDDLYFRPQLRGLGGAASTTLARRSPPPSSACVRRSDRSAPGRPRPDRSAPGRSRPDRLASACSASRCGGSPASARPNCSVGLWGRRRRRWPQTKHWLWTRASPSPIY